MDYKKLAKMNAYEQSEAIKKALGYDTLLKPPKWWLDTRYPLLNAVLGSKKRGIGGGKSIVLCGKKSSGKTLIAAKIAGWAQQDQAKVGWIDLEESFDSVWVKIHGLDPGDPVRNKAGKIVGYTNVALFRPELGYFRAMKIKGKREKGSVFRLQTAEEVFKAGEEWMIAQRAIDPKCRICMVVDSTTAVIPEEQVVAGLTDANMRTNMLAQFLNNLTKRWCALGPNVNSIIVYIAQLRTNPKMMFGNPEYITGGSGILYFPHVIVKVARAKKGTVLQNGMAVGVKSIMENLKNKTGGGSVEFQTCGYKVYFQKQKMQVVSAKELKGEA